MSSTATGKTFLDFQKVPTYHAKEEEDGSNLLSPDTEEFLNLEKQLTSNNNIINNNNSGSFSSTCTDQDQEEIRKEFHTELENKLEERRRSTDESDLSLQLLEKRGMRQFSRADEYLYAMKEDLAEWLNILYPYIDIDAENFMDRLETGEHLIKHANSVRQKAVELLAKIAAGETLQKFPDLKFPERDLPLRTDVSPGTWFARDNVFNFIRFCRILGVMDCIMFETEDLVCRKNEKHVILTILEVARRGAKIGVLAPMLVQFEQEIDVEIAREERELRRREEKEEERLRRKREQEEERVRRKREQEEEKEQERLRKKKEMEERALANCDNNFTSMMVEVGGDDEINNMDDFNEGDDEAEEESEAPEEEEEEEEDEDYAFPIGPMPQMITNDLKSLDEMVRELVSECQCPTQFPMIRVSDGKYRIGETKVLIFVRILRNHVMVRVGGGWDTLQHYLDKHDPCRCKAGHRSTLGAHISLKTQSGNPGGKTTLTGGAICYDRSSSPITSSNNVRRSSTSNLSGYGSRRSSNNLGPPPISPFLTQDRLRSHSPLVQNSKYALANSSSAKEISTNGSASSSRSGQDNGRYLSPANSRNPSFSQIPSQKMSERSNSSGSLANSNSSTNSNTSSNNHNGGNGNNGNACDSSSEVSDEGYKSSQGCHYVNGGRENNVSQQQQTVLLEEEEDRHLKLHGKDIEGSPASSRTLASDDCSSSISSDDEENGHKMEEETKLSDISDILLATSPEPSNNNNNKMAENKKKINHSISTETTSRLNNLFNTMKIPKFNTNKRKEAESNVISSPEGGPPSPTRSLGGGSYQWKKPARSRSISSEQGGAERLGGFSRNSTERSSLRSNSSCNASSRYMQAAEAYAARNRAANEAKKQQQQQQGYGTWSSSSRSRPAISGDTYRKPVDTSRNCYSRPVSRNASASPGAQRRYLRKSSSNCSDIDKDYNFLSPTTTTTTNTTRYLPSSTKSTPSKKPSRKTSQQKIANELEHDDDLILKRMEEILMTYKSKVEDHLAAEGRELPKEIFEDFTTQWVNEASTINASLKTKGSSRSSSRNRGCVSPANSNSSLNLRSTPQWRREHREGRKETKIPVPTFYNSPIPNETQI